MESEAPGAHPPPTTPPRCGMTRYAAGLAVLVAAGVAAGQPPAEKARPIALLYGHDLRVRPGGQKDWKDAPRVGVEFFHDAANGSLLAVSEAGSLAAAPFAPLGEKREAEWVFAHDVRRPQGRRGEVHRRHQEVRRRGVQGPGQQPPPVRQRGEGDRPGRRAGEPGHRQGAGVPPRAGHPGPRRPTRRTGRARRSSASRRSGTATPAGCSTSPRRAPSPPGRPRRCRRPPTTRRPRSRCTG